MCSGNVRIFETGATRDISTDKPDYAGFISALATKRFGEYMHKHRLQSDGQLRDADNWKKGMPIPEYWRSMRRHVEDVALHFEGFPAEARETLEEALCAVIFNAQGMLHEMLKERR